MSEERQEYKSGAASSKAPRFDLIPRAALIALASRFELGQMKYAEKAWNAGSSQACLTDREFVIARAAHVVDHALKLIAKLHGAMEDDGDDDAGAIAWAGMFLSEAVRELKSGEKTQA